MDICEKNTNTIAKHTPQTNTTAKHPQFFVVVLLFLSGVLVSLQIYVSCFFFYFLCVVYINTTLKQQQQTINAAALHTKMCILPKIYKLKKYI